MIESAVSKDREADALVKLQRAISRFCIPASASCLIFIDRGDT